MNKSYTQYSMRKMLSSFLDAPQTGAAMKAICKFRPTIGNMYIDCDDIIQNLYIKFVDLKSKYDEVTPALIYTSTRNLILNVLKRKSSKDLNPDTFYSKVSNDSHRFADAKIEYDRLSDENKMVLKLKCGVMTHRQLASAGVTRTDIRRRAKFLEARGCFV